MNENEALLNLFQKADNKDLKQLADVITKGKDGDYRLNELLSVNVKYATCYPHDMRSLIPEIIDELQCYGANTIVTLLRGGRGVPYSTILRDVAKKLKVSYNKHTCDENIEKYILQKMFDDIASKMSESELRALAESMRIRVAADYTRQTIIAILQAAIRRGGFQSYIWIVVVANALSRALLGRGLSLAANALLMRAVSILTGPVSVALNGLWLAIDLAGPAYRVTIPAVVQIAYIRNKIQNPEWDRNLVVCDASFH